MIRTTLLTIFSDCQATPEGRCPVAPSERKECGYYGITKEECLKKQCCWDDTVANTKWCFKQPGESDKPITITTQAPTEFCSNQLKDNLSF